MFLVLFVVLVFLVFFHPRAAGGSSRGRRLESRSGWCGGGGGGASLVLVGELNRLDLIFGHVLERQTARRRSSRGGGRGGKHRRGHLVHVGHPEILRLGCGLGLGLGGFGAGSVRAPGGDLGCVGLGGRVARRVCAPGGGGCRMRGLCGVAAGGEVGVRMVHGRAVGEGGGGGGEERRCEQEGRGAHRA